MIFDWLRKAGGEAQNAAAVAKPLRAFELWRAIHVAIRVVSHSVARCRTALWRFTAWRDIVHDIIVVSRRGASCRAV